LVDLIALTNAFVDTLRLIPQLVADLDQGSPDSIVPYIDVNPQRNSWTAAIYQMKPGTVMVIWQETLLTEGEMSAWMHRVQFCVRAQRGASAMTLLNDIVNGVPDPGNTLRWRFCPVMDGVLPTNVTEIARLTDEEGIDYFVITTETRETGDA
jgi:hypothetical protein